MLLKANINHYPFGSPMPGRQYTSSSSYRYGMNGQERDDEIAQGIYTAEYWEYDSRTGRRWNIDPIVKIHESPYACFSDNPIYFADPTGSNTVTPISNPEVGDVDPNTGATYNGNAWDLESVVVKPEGQVNQPSGTGSGNNPQLTSVSTVNASASVPPPHVGFTVEAISGGGGSVVGGEATIKKFVVPGNDFTKDFLYPGTEIFTVVEFDIKGGVNGGAVSATAGDGYLKYPDPWKRRSDDISGISDYDKSASFSFLTISTTEEVTLGVSRLHYTMMGVSLGSEVKFESPIDVGAGFNKTILSNTPEGKSIKDSAHTAGAFPNHPISQSFNSRHPRK